MFTSTRARTAFPLDHPQVRFAHHPFYAETLSLPRSVRDHDLESLQWLCDDFGVVDVDPTGQARVIRSKAQCIQRLHELLPTLDAVGADTDSEAVNYRAVRAHFDCIATIVWKKTNLGWCEARWHGSVISSEIPDELRELSERAV